jgi:hypothetical protein
MNRYATKVATAISQALGLGGPTCLQGLSPEALARISVHGHHLAREAAAFEIIRRHMLTTQQAQAKPAK